MKSPISISVISSHGEALKRKLASCHSEGGSTAKKKYLETTRFSEKITTINRAKHPLTNLEVAKKIQTMMSLVTSSLFATPFLTSETNNINSKSNINNQTKSNQYSSQSLSLHEVNEKLRLKLYSHSDEVFNDLDFIFSLRVQEKEHLVGVTLADENYRRRNKELDLMTKELKKIVVQCSESINADMRILQNPVTSKIYNALDRRFPHVDKEHLKLKACEVADGKDEDIWKNVLQRINVENRNQNPSSIFKKIRFVPSEEPDFDEDHVVHFYRAAYQYHKMISMWSEPSRPFPIPLRKVTDVSDSIAHIDYIINPQLEKQFEEQKNAFRQENKEVEEVLLFHGTAVASVDSILQTNFLLDHSPAPQAGHTKGRSKKSMFGRGVYFSSQPAISLMYGSGLVLCKVVLGRCQDYRPRPQIVQQEIPDEYDSRKVMTRDGSEVIHVVRSPTQILPYCIIQLKNDSLSSEYHKPCILPTSASGQGSTSALSTSVSTTTSITTSKAFALNYAANIPDASASSSPFLSNGVITPGLPSNLTKEQQVTNTFDSFTKPVVPTLSIKATQEGSFVSESSTCPVCMEPLDQGVVSLPCLHLLHSTCALQSVANGTAGPACLQCPECRAIHGTRTGTSPLASSMTWTNMPSSLPGHPEDGTIAITFHVQPGHQGPEHPNPGAAYHALNFPRTALLPDTKEGQTLLSLLTLAFRRRLLFSVGPSVSRGLEDCVVWAGVHLKTRERGEHGYPDSGYLARLSKELREVGVVEDQEGIEDQERTKTEKEEEIHPKKESKSQHEKSSNTNKKKTTKCSKFGQIDQIIENNAGSSGRGREGDRRILLA